MPLAFGLINEDKLNLPYEELINEIENAVAMFSYSPSKPPDFLGFFQYLTTYFQDCEEPAILEKLTESLSSIAGYKLGLRVAEVFLLAQSIILKLLANPNINSMKIAVDYARKVSRVIGPRIVLKKFIIPNVNNIPCQRGLTIMATLAITDHPKFSFVEEDFDMSWVGPLSEVVGVGPRLINAIKAKLPNYKGNSECNDILQLQRPPSVPVKFNFIKDIQKEEKNAENEDNFNRRHAPSTARPPLPPRILSKSKNSNVKSDGSSSIIFHMTNRQQQIREFIDEPFNESENTYNYLQQCRTLLASKDWEQRSAAYNQAKRILRYSTDSFTDDDIHQLITVAIDDMASQRAALALSSIGALNEAFLQAPASMSIELGRVLPVLIKLHQKNGQYFENALSNCFQAIIENISPKRFLTILIPNCETKSSKVQIAISKYIRASLEKVAKRQLQQTPQKSFMRNNMQSNSSLSLSQDKFFTKKSNEVKNLIVVINNLLKAPAADTREAAKDCVKLLYEIYDDSLYQIVDSSLQPREVAEFQKYV